MAFFSIKKVSFILTIIGFIVCVSFLIMNHLHATPSPLSKLSVSDYANGTKRAAEAKSRVLPRLNKELEAKHLTFGSPVFIRIFKETKQLELWIESQRTKKFVLFKTYPIAAMSGNLGPKLAEGDRQAPEGFYAVSKRLLNPTSRFHLSFNIGYPNAYDRAHKRTGSAIMVHGNRVSIGCYAMTDEKIEEIYTLCDAALNNGQPFFRVHSFPFPLTDENLETHKNSKWYSFWQELQPVYSHFEQHKRPPNVLMNGGTYSFEMEL